MQEVAGRGVPRANANAGKPFCKALEVARTCEQGDEPMAITPQPGISDIALYQGGDAHVDGVNRVIKLSSNENPLGPSPLARAAYLEAAGSMEVYPSSDHAGLRAAIAEVHGLDADRIICGAGSDEIISFLCTAYAGPGDEVLYSEHGFLMYPISAQVAGATPVTARETSRHANVDALIAGVNPDTRLVFVANPNNPTGTMIPVDDLARLAEALPDECLLVIDGAYAEYVDDYDGGAALVAARDNVVMTRTFSKIFGLGGLRVGWAYAPGHVIDTMNRVRGPFNVSAPGLAAAEAAMRDQDYVASCKAANARWRDWLAAELDGLGLPSDRSLANFILVQFPDEDAAKAADDWLRKFGLIVRRVAGYGLPHCLRITVGDEDACRSIVKFMSEFQKGARA